MSTIAVMGTLFTMDQRLDTGAPPKNKFHRCSHPLTTDFLIPPVSTPRADVIEAWELVIERVSHEDSGDYICRLTGERTQSIHYVLSVKGMAVLCNYLATILCTLSPVFSVKMKACNPVLNTFSLIWCNNSHKRRLKSSSFISDLCMITVLTGNY